MCGPGTGRIEDLPRLHPADLPIIQQVAYKLLTLGREQVEKDAIRLITYVALVITIITR